MCKISEIKGIGEKKTKILNKLKVFSISDMAEYYPRDYKDKTQITKVADMKKGEAAVFLCKVEQKPELIRIKNMRLVRVRVCDETGSVYAVWFNMPYMKAALKVGATYFMACTPSLRYDRLSLINPETELFDGGESLSNSRIVPVYKACAGLSQKDIRKAVKAALEHSSLKIEDCVPQSVAAENGLCDKEFAVRNIHFPESSEAFLKSRERLCFDELFVLQTALFKFKKANSMDISGFKLNPDINYEEIIESLPFELTNAQKNTLSEIKSDMESGTAMNRLIQGDVGSGKTAVALIAAFWVIQSGRQTALMAPTEVLATQHFESISKIFGKFGISAVLLKGALSKKMRDEALSKISSGKAKIVIGTQAIIQKTVIFQKLGLVITDEQHRFGVNQRAALIEKAERPHVLVMTATPIPRTLALILYGDLDISVIDELPPGRTPIETYAVSGEMRARIYNFIKKQVDSGRQAYIICPAIEVSESDDAPLKGVSQAQQMQYVSEYIKEISERVFVGYRTAALHGKMKPAEKDEIMSAFAAGEIDILVSTTVIEVGVNVPNATVMVIENAERFGLSQLHQLRGRVGRSVFQSYCILISDSEGETSKKRLETLKKTTDGFVISEMDLELRGSGDFFGTKQHGLPELKIANLFKDIETLKKAQKSAARVLESDPLLELPENMRLSQKIEGMFYDIKFGVNL